MYFQLEQYGSAAWKVFVMSKSGKQMLESDLYANKRNANAAIKRLREGGLATAKVIEVPL